MLPATGREPVVQHPEKHLVTGSGRILVMDDVEMIRDLAGAALEALGYEAVLARDGAEAVALYAEAMQAGKPFAAVIMDLIVPGGVGGEEAVQALRRLDPLVKAVVSSGYSQDPVMANYAAYGFCAVLPKPYSIARLGELLHAILSGQGNQPGVSPPDSN